MNTNFNIALAVIAGAALGATAMQGLHAQAKPKAYQVVEYEVLDAAAAAAYAPLTEAANKAAGARSFNTAPGGRIIAGVGEPPKGVALREWDSLEQLQAYQNSAVFKKLALQRDKAVKITRAYVVEAAN
jgi:uncharacterized protein (DUF1330 family)